MDDEEVEEDDEDEASQISVDSKSDKSCKSLYIANISCRTTPWGDTTVLIKRQTSQNIKTLKKKMNVVLSNYEWRFGQWLKE